MTQIQLVRFLEDDRWGAWSKGQVAEDLGPIPGMHGTRALKLMSGEIYELNAPFARGLIEPID